MSKITTRLRHAITALTQYRTPDIDTAIASLTTASDEYANANRLTEAEEIDSIIELLEDEDSSPDFDAICGRIETLLKAESDEQPGHSVRQPITAKPPVKPERLQAKGPAAVAAAPPQRPADIQMPAAPPKKSGAAALIDSLKASQDAKDEQAELDEVIEQTPTVHADTTAAPQIVLSPAPYSPAADEDDSCMFVIERKEEEPPTPEVDVAPPAAQIGLTPATDSPDSPDGTAMFQIGAPPQEEEVDDEPTVHAETIESEQEVVKMPAAELEEDDESAELEIHVEGEEVPEEEPAPTEEIQVEPLHSGDIEPLSEDQFEEELTRVVAPALEETETPRPVEPRVMTQEDGVNEEPDIAAPQILQEGPDISAPMMLDDVSDEVARAELVNAPALPPIVMMPPSGTDDSSLTIVSATPAMVTEVSPEDALIGVLDKILVDQNNFDREQIADEIAEISHEVVRENREASDALNNIRRQIENDESSEFIMDAINQVVEMLTPQDDQSTPSSFDFPDDVTDQPPPEPDGPRVGTGVAPRRTDEPQTPPMPPLTPTPSTPSGPSLDELVIALRGILGKMLNPDFNRIEVAGDLVQLALELHTIGRNEEAYRVEDLQQKIRHAVSLNEFEIYLELKSIIDSLKGESVPVAGGDYEEPIDALKVIRRSLVGMDFNMLGMTAGLMRIGQLMTVRNSSVDKSHVGMTISSLRELDLDNAIDRVGLLIRMLEQEREGLLNPSEPEVPEDNFFQEDEQEARGTPRWIPAVALIGGAAILSCALLSLFPELFWLPEDSSLTEDAVADASEEDTDVIADLSAAVGEGLTAAGVTADELVDEASRRIAGEVPDDSPDDESRYGETVFDTGEPEETIIDAEPAGRQEPEPTTPSATPAPLSPPIAGGRTPSEPETLPEPTPTPYATLACTGRAVHFPTADPTRTTAYVVMKIGSQRATTVIYGVTVNAAGECAFAAEPTKAVPARCFKAEVGEHAATSDCPSYRVKRVKPWQS